MAIIDKVEDVDRLKQIKQAIKIEKDEYEYEYEFRKLIEQ